MATSGFRHAMLNSRYSGCLSCSAMIVVCSPWAETLVSDLESRFHVVCELNYYYFRFSSRHVEFEMLRVSAMFRDDWNVFAMVGNPSSDLESRFYVVCELNYYNFRFSSRHVEFEMFRFITYFLSEMRVT